MLPPRAAQVIGTLYYILSFMTTANLIKARACGRARPAAGRAPSSV